MIVAIKQFVQKWRISVKIVKKTLDIRPEYFFNRNNIDENNIIEDENNVDDKNNMEVVENTSNYIKEASIDEKDIVFFDIETTGLSAINSVLYLIGVAFYDDNSWQFIQWFADECDDEVKLIDAFFEVLKNKKYLIHYNGNGFDIPYIKKKIEQYDMNYTFENIESIDLYNTVKKYKKMLALDNCRLVTIEKYLSIVREDKYNGKELIDTYKEFIKIYSLEKLKGDLDKSSILLKDLLLHNEEDIINLLAVTRIKYLDDLFAGNMIFDEYDIKEDRVCCKYHTDYKLPINNNIEITRENCIVKINTDNSVVIEIAIYNEVLKYYYEDYKNYYYLIKEDVAVHKSVAQYVDKEYRVQAKPSTCYIKKEDKYVPAFNYKKDKDTKRMLEFKREYKDKQSFYQLSIIKDMDKYGKTVLYELI